jgi:hypothetical protein
VSRIKALDATLLAKEGYEHSTLYWNLRQGNRMKNCLHTMGYEWGL